MSDDTAPVGERGSEGEEDEVAAGHEGVGQAVLAHRYRHIARQRGVGDFGQSRNFERVALAKLWRPVATQGPEAVEQPLAA